MRPARLHSSAPERSTPAIGPILHATWSTFRGRFPACLAVYWGAFAAEWLIILSGQGVVAGLSEAVRDPAFDEFAQFLLFLVGTIVPVWLQIGLYRALLQIARQEPVAFEELFRGGRYLLTTLLAEFLVLAIAAAPALVAQALVEALLSRAPALTILLGALPFLAVAGAPPAILAGIEAGIVAELERPAIRMILAGLGVVVLTLPAIVAILIRLGQFSYLILDHGAGVWDALRGSWRLTRGRVATVLSAYCLYLAINCAGLLAACVGWVFTFPLTSLLLAETYLALSEVSPIPVPADSGSWEEDDSD